MSNSEIKKVATAPSNEEQKVMQLAQLSNAFKIVQSAFNTTPFLPQDFERIANVIQTLATIGANVDKQLQDIAAEQKRIKEEAEAVQAALNSSTEDAGEESLED